MMRKSVLFCYITLILVHCTKNNCDFSAKIQKNIFNIEILFHKCYDTLREQNLPGPTGAEVGGSCQIM